MDWRTTWRWILQSDTPISNVLQSHCIVIIHEQTRRLESAASREESLDPRGIIYGVQNPLDGWLVQFLKAASRSRELYIPVSAGNQSA